MAARHRLVQRHRRLGEQLLKQLPRRPPGEGIPPGEQVVRDGCQTVDVGAAVHQLARQGLGGDVLERPHKESRAGEALFGRQLRVPCDPEIEQPRPARGRVVHDVLGFEIAMHYSSGVRGRQAVGQLAHQVGRKVGSERSVVV